MNKHTTLHVALLFLLLASLVLLGDFTKIAREMSKAVTWEYLNAEQVHRCLTADDVVTLRNVIRDADTTNGGALFASPTSFPLSEEQTAIFLDLYVHLIRFAQGMGFSPEKVSTLVGIFRDNHFHSMKGRVSNVQAYKDFENRLVAHSVHRPPFSAQIFSLDDAKLISDYALNTYFRHYKLYMYTFTPREVAEVRCVSLSTPHNVPPSHVPSLSKAVPLAQWEAAQEEQRKAEEERQEKLAQERAAAAAEAERLAQEAERPHMTAGLKNQLDAIKSTVSKMSREKLDELEAKLIALEGRVAEVNKPMSAGAKVPVKPPGKK